MFLHVGSDFRNQYGQSSNDVPRFVDYLFSDDFISICHSVVSTTTGAACIFPFNFGGVRRQIFVEDEFEEREMNIHSRLRIEPVPFWVRTILTLDHNVLLRLIRPMLHLRGAFAKVGSYLSIE